MRFHIRHLRLTTIAALVFLSFPLNAQTPSQGFYLDGWQPKSVQVTAFDRVEATGRQATVSVSVDAGAPGIKVSPYIYGHNAAAWGGKLDQSTIAVREIKNLAPQVIRWPGGSMSNEYFWKATSKATAPQDVPPDYNYKDLLYGSNNNSWTMSVDNFYSLLQKTNSIGSISVNYSYARIGTSEDPVRTAAKYAADWVRYDNGRTRFWEIGNENMGSWEVGYEIDTKLNKDGQPKTISGDLYGRHCKIFIEEMRKAAKEVGNDIKIGVVAMDSHVTYNSVMMNWNKGMMPHIAGLADFLIVHSYYTPYDQNSNVATILNSPPTTRNLATYVNDGMKTHAKSDPLPLALTEWNIFATGSAQGVSYINGMHATMVLGELIKNAFGQANRWDFVNGWNNGDNHGLLADGEPGIARYTPRAPFFYMYYFQKFFGDKMVPSTVTGSSAVVSYASRFNSGPAGIVLVNKGTQEEVVRVGLNNFKPGKRFYYYLLTGGTDNGDFSGKVYVNGKTTTQAGGGPSDYATLRPYGADLDKEIMIVLPKWSVVYLLAESDTNLLPQTIKFDPVPAKTMGDAPFEISATASSGLPVEFAVSNPLVATVSNGQIRLVGAGTCDITACQGGDTLYLAAGKVTRTLTVSKAGQTIEFPEMPVKQTGDADFPAGGAASSGLPVAYTSSNTSVATIVNGLIRIAGKGTTVITARQSGNKNYLPAEAVTRELTVTPATSISGLHTENDFSLYPNPVKETVTIRFAGHNPGFIIYNILGTRVYGSEDPAQEHTLPAEKLGGPGIYILKSGQATRKFVLLK